MHFAAFLSSLRELRLKGIIYKRRNQDLKIQITLTEFLVECETLKHALVHQSLFCWAIWDQFGSLGFKLALQDIRKRHTFNWGTFCDVAFSVSEYFVKMTFSPPGKNRLRKIH